MKKMKSGFTLAEVLITLGIIGVVAALVMPSVISSYQYKTVGVKLAKFASQLEGAARPFVVSNNNFDSTEDTGNLNNIQAFLQESFIVTNAGELENEDGFDGITDNDPGNQDGTDEGVNKPLPEFSDDNRVFNLKDGTSMMVYTLDDDYRSNITNTEDTAVNASTYDNRQVGDAMFAVRFAPRVQGLPRNAQQTYDFVVTELGYVYPHSDDACLINIVGADYITNARTYSNNACSNSDRGTTAED